MLGMKMIEHRACLRRGGRRGLGYKRQDVDAFTSHIHLMRPPSGGLFACAGPLASRRHGTMQRLIRTEVDEVLPVLLEEPAWNRMCQIAPTVGLAYCKLLLS